MKKSGEDAATNIKGDEKMKNETDAAAAPSDKKDKNAPKDVPKVLLEMKKIKCLNADDSNKWSGSLTFLKKYVSKAISRIEAGPKVVVDPSEEFILNDIEDFCKYKCVEVEKNQKYKCQMCGKHFKGEDYVTKHIKNKHKDLIDETYDQETTKDWLNKTLNKNFKRLMKENYY